MSARAHRTRMSVVRFVMLLCRPSPAGFPRFVTLTLVRMETGSTKVQHVLVCSAFEVRGDTCHSADADAGRCCSTFPRPVQCTEQRNLAEHPGPGAVPCERVTPLQAGLWIIRATACRHRSRATSASFLVSTRHGTKVQRSYVSV